MSITIDKNLCIGCGACSAICPNAFKMNEDNKAEFISQENSGCIKDAAEGCPVQAIKVG